MHYREVGPAVGSSGPLCLESMPCYCAAPTRPCGAMWAQSKTRQIAPVGGGAGWKRNSAMPKRHLEAAAQHDRAKQRQKLGTLRDLTVQPATKQRYNRAMINFLNSSMSTIFSFPPCVTNWTHWFVITLSISGLPERVGPLLATQSPVCRTMTFVSEVSSREPGGSWKHGLKMKSLIGHLRYPLMWFTQWSDGHGFISGSPLECRCCWDFMGCSEQEKFLTCGGPIS